MKSIAVYCGSSIGASPVYQEGARALGYELAERGIALIYGGASVGLMGEVASSVLEKGGRAIGVLPSFLQDREIAHTTLSELIIVDSMHERKAKMAELADGFIALPGGPGTMEEYFEILTWGQLALHHKPCGLLNIHHYYDSLIALFDHMAQERFMHDNYRSMVITDTTPSGILDQFANYTPPAVKTYRMDQRARS
ncbi:TIGR00730 family Rossman fold protein [Paenibacillus sp. 79R4]|uniref:LOG family protein n=1 Tax=Paenibacillus sp. 79R4 TaxID=2212847 RepID=UPI0015C036BF|nr:TIGR00730 family Rossman fold protein [Paenibacillus sp. 79R4]NWL88694.1 TIGR00730 family Rossman fold protein [Paenibacillus sp. 79R4]